MLRFTNSSPFDLECLMHFGASVKNGQNPIGKYGSGLKFAIATLMRNSVEFRMTIDGEEAYFFSKTKAIRGKEFDVIFVSCMGEEIELPITTQAGPEWGIWQAVREIYANCLDEGGEVDFLDIPVSEGTAFYIGLPNSFLDQVLVPKDKTLLFESESIQIYSGKSQFIYYQGFRASSQCFGTALTYNIKTPLELTEDRFIKSYCLVGSIVGAAAVEAKYYVAKEIITSRSSFDRSFVSADEVSENYELPDFFAQLAGSDEAIASFRSLALCRGLIKPDEATRSYESFVSDIAAVCESYGAEWYSAGAEIIIDTYAIDKPPF